MPRKKIIIIGANSYIGRNLIFTFMHYRTNDYEIKLYDRAKEHADGVKCYKCIDVLSDVSIRELDLDCDAIFMMVGMTGSVNGFDEYNTSIDVNEKALLNLLNEYRRQKSKAKIIFPSTRLVYKGQPYILNEDAEKEFRTIYSINKYACEQYLEQYNKVFGVQYCIFRICVPYGTMVEGAYSYGTFEFMMKKVMAGENISLYGDGSVRRTLTYVLDLCNVMINGALSEKCVNDVFNIGGENYSLREMAEPIASKYNVGIEYVPWPDTAGKIESGDTVFDDTKIRGILNIGDYYSYKKWVESL